MEILTQVWFLFNYLVPTNTRLRENEITLQSNTANLNMASTRNLINNDNSNTNLNNIVLGTNNIIPNRENSLNEYSNFNLNVYSEFTGNNIEDNSNEMMNRNFDTQLDEIFDNLTYLITTEK